MTQKDKESLQQLAHKIANHAQDIASKSDMLQCLMERSPDFVANVIDDKIANKISS